MKLFLLEYNNITLPLVCREEAHLLDIDTSIYNAPYYSVTGIPVSEFPVCAYISYKEVNVGEIPTRLSHQQIILLNYLSKTFIT